MLVIISDPSLHFFQRLSVVGRHEYVTLFTSRQQGVQLCCFLVPRWYSHACITIKISWKYWKTHKYSRALELKGINLQHTWVALGSGRAGSCLETEELQELEISPPHQLYTSAVETVSDWKISQSFPGLEGVAFWCSLSYTQLPPPLTTEEIPVVGQPSSV